MIKNEVIYMEEEGVKENIEIVVGMEMVEKFSELLKEFKELKKRGVDLGKIVEKLEGGETECEVTFNKLTLDGSIKIRIMPLKKE